jgi:excisionase family DNA binding protein
LTQLESTSVSETYLTVAEIAELLKLNQQTVRNMIDRGELAAVRVGPRRVRVRQSDLDLFLASAEPAKKADLTFLVAISDQETEQPLTPGDALPRSGSTGCRHRARTRRSGWGLVGGATRPVRGDSHAPSLSRRRRQTRQTRQTVDSAGHTTPSVCCASSGARRASSVQIGVNLQSLARPDTGEVTWEIRLGASN